MTVARTNHTTNTVLGNGEIYVDVLDADGNLQGERYLGDSVGATLSVTSERTTIQSGDGPVAQDLVDIVRSVSRTMGFTLRDSSVPNWALFLLGLEGAVAIEATEVAAESHGTVLKGRVIQLGQGAANPLGVAIGSDGEANLVGEAADSAGSGKTSVASAASASGNASATAQAGNWQLDRKTGRITALKDLYKVAVTYTPSAITADAAKATGDATQITCALRYLEERSSSGQGRSVYIRKCNLVPGGEAALKSRETEQQMAFTATVQDPGGGFPAIAIGGKAAE
ncbi:MAG: hypothetical protein F4Y03_09340 [Alphaproteobacteria bacterium]|nr:hypothetical protein [Alphaproteobacteria bacterium]